MFSSSGRTEPVDVNDVTFIMFVAKLLTSMFVICLETITFIIKWLLLFDNITRKGLDPSVKILQM